MSAPLTVGKLYTLQAVSAMARYKIIDDTSCEMVFLPQTTAEYPITGDLPLLYLGTRKLANNGVFVTDIHLFLVGETVLGIAAWMMEKRYQAESKITEQSPESTQPSPQSEPE